MKDFFTGNKLKLFLHLFAWAILLGIPLYLSKRWEVGKEFIWFFLINTLISGIIFYFNYLILVPRYFFEKRRHRYFLSVLFFLAFTYFLSSEADQMVFRNISDQNKKDNKSEQVISQRSGREMQGPPKPGALFGHPPFREMHFLNYSWSALFLVFFSLGLRVLERHSETEELQKELEKEKLNSELAFLKNQISPHFFFNTLNNIYSLISINAEDSQKAVLKLSKLMRYLLYDSEQGNKHLSEEIGFMVNYIDLMKLRMSDKIKLSISFPEKFDDISIPPLLFIPFIENAFKHGISYREKSYIDISMRTESDSLAFRCANSLFKTRDEAENGQSGIGLENVSKRLNLLFPGKHKLEINKTDNSFEVLLFINFT
jgi:two-component system, LytTR family, sensor kinase